AESWRWAERAESWRHRARGAELETGRRAQSWRLTVAHRAGDTDCEAQSWRHGL
ncbi:hypothetical protein NDU88_006882, partial [Pleurodeles waltl]